MSTILSLVALVVSLSLLGRVKNLERSMAAGAKPAVAAANPEPAAPAVAAAVVGQPEPVSAPVPKEPSVFETALAWMAKDWLMKLGAVLLFLGIGWIVTTFFWDAIGPVGHVTIGFAIGILFLVFGERRIRQYHNQGGVFAVLGAGVIHLTSYAASPAHYDLIPPIAALGFMFLTAVFVTYLAIATRLFTVALFGLVLGLIAPLLSGSAEASFTGLFSYLFVLAAGTLWTSRVTGWRSLTLLSVIAYAVYAMPYIEDHRLIMGDMPAAMLIILFGILYFLVGILSIITDRKAVPADLWVTAVNSLVILAWIHTLVPTADGRALFCVLVAFVASVGAFITYRNTGLKEPVAIHSLSAAAFIVAATAYALDESMFRLAIMLEASAVIIGWRMLFGAEASRKAALVSVVPIAIGIISLAEYAGRTASFMGGEPPVLDSNFALVAVAIALFASYGYVFRGSEHPENGSMTLSRFFSAAAALMALVLFWSFAQRLMPGDAGTMLSLFVYTSIGLVLYVAGRIGVRAERKVPGALLLAFVVGHLLLVDIGRMDTVGRIVTFTLVGLLLISTAFIRKKDQISSGL